MGPRRAGADQAPALIGCTGGGIERAARSGTVHRVPSAEVDSDPTKQRAASDRTRHFTRCPDPQAQPLGTTDRDFHRARRDQRQLGAR